MTRLAGGLSDTVQDLTRVLCGCLSLVAVIATAAPAPGHSRTAGELAASDARGKPMGICPLEHTAVRGEISGILSRVTITQRFGNPFTEPIEAVYTFPLPHDAAVDDMTIRTGERVIRGIVRRRDEARQEYEQARTQGKLAALLNQERANIFTQSIANILPGRQVEITISYVGTLEYADGAYQFVFPMVVGPRYIPGTPSGRQGGGWARDTDSVRDASRITPPVAEKGTRAGHDISIEVDIDSGVPFAGLRSTQHEIVVLQRNNHSALVHLADKAVIPNRDFILTYDVAGSELKDGLVTHRSSADGYFMLLLQPPMQVPPAQVTPKELVFVLDTSGSMQGYPIEKAKETMKLALDGIHAGDTFNLITFSGDTRILFPEPVPATPANLRKAQEFLANTSGNGGTEMMKAIRAALAPSDSRAHMRVVCFMTDGLVGNDLEIISEVQQHPNARIFAFGIGTSVNRFLLTRIAEEGRGAAEIVTPGDDAAAAARRFHQRVRSPFLTDITVDWSGLPVEDVYPHRIPDLFSAQPVVVCGRYARGGHAFVRLRGKVCGRELVRELAVPLPETEPQHGVLARLWARRRIEAVMGLDYTGIQRGTPLPEIRNEIERLGLQHRLLTQYTSFVAVEERVVTDGGRTRRIEVPVEMPEGTSHEGIFGPAASRAQAFAGGVVVGAMGGVSGGVVGGIPGGVVGGVIGGAVPPPPPPAQGPAREPIRVGGNVQESKLIRREEPVYSQLAKQTRLGTSLILEVTVDEKGNVAAARILRGHPLLDEAALAAVRQWKYTPTLLNGTPVKVIATVILKYDSRERGKLHPEIALLISRIAKALPADPAEKEFVRGGMAELELTLTAGTQDAIRELKAFGFLISGRAGSPVTIIGWLPIDKLDALRVLPWVSFIAPNRRSQRPSTIGLSETPGVPSRVSSKLREAINSSS